MLFEAQRRKSGDSPVLALAVKQVRRGADTYLAQYLLLTAPAEAAAGVCANSDVGDQANAHACLARPLLHLLQTALAQPLGEGVELDFGGMGAGELIYGCGIRLAQSLRPAPPVAALAPGQHDLLQGFMAAVLLQLLRALLEELLEVLMQLGRRIRPLPMQFAQQFQAQGGDRRPVDQRLLFQLPCLFGQMAFLHGPRDHLRSEHLLGGCVEDIEMVSAGG